MTWGWGVKFPVTVYLTSPGRAMGPREYDLAMRLARIRYPNAIIIGPTSVRSVY